MLSIPKEPSHNNNRYAPVEKRCPTNEISLHRNIPTFNEKKMFLYEIGYFYWIVAIFEETDCNAIFKNKSVFSKDYVPKSILHRDQQIKQIANGLRYIMQGQRPTDQIIHGTKGTGKTLVARFVVDELSKTTPKVKVYYVSLKHARTDFMALEKIIEKMLGKGPRGKSWIKGNSFGYGSDLIFDHISSLNEKYVVLILDEINKIEYPDMLLHTLLRPNEVYGDLKGKEVSYIFISNDPKFPKNLSEGTESSYTSVTKRVFPKYTAEDLKNILNERVQEGLNPGVCADIIIAMCAAYGAQVDGDARRTIEYLQKAGEIAVEQQSPVINEEHVKMAREQIEFDALGEILKTQPAHHKAVALACIWDIKHHTSKTNYTSTTGSIYNEYKAIMRQLGLEVLTQRRVTDILGELTRLSFIDSDIISHGRYGRTKHVTLLTSFEMEKTLLEDRWFTPLR